MFKAFIAKVDIQRVIKGGSAHTALIKQGYKQSDTYSRHGVKWVEMRKEITR